jgi:surfactin synthase thioesterase subunit
LPGREDRIQEPPLEALLPLTERLAEDLAPCFDVPFAVYGHSMGSLIGFEFARQVRRNLGLEPEHLFVAGYFAPHVPSPFQTRKDWDESELAEAVQQLLDAPEALLADRDFLRALLPTIKADLRLVGGYRYMQEEPLACPITAFGGRQDSEVKAADLAEWQLHTRGQFEQRMFPGKHLFLLSDRDELVAAIAEALEVGEVVGGARA